jgi:hypothetical protein
VYHAVIPLAYHLSWWLFCSPDFVDKAVGSSRVNSETGFPAFTEPGAFVIFHWNTGGGHSWHATYVAWGQGNNADIFCHSNSHCGDLTAQSFYRTGHGEGHTAWAEVYHARDYSATDEVKK